MMMCKVKLAIVALVLIAAPALGSDCVTTPPSCITTPACPIAQNGTAANDKPGKEGALSYLITNNDCDKLVDGTILLDRKHCRRFYVCFNRRAMRQPCDVGLWFDRVKRQCLPRAQVTNCPENRN